MFHRFYNSIWTLKMPVLITTAWCPPKVVQTSVPVFVFDRSSRPSLSSCTEKSVWQLFVWLDSKGVSFTVWMPCCETDFDMSRLRFVSSYLHILLYVLFSFTSRYRCSKHKLKREQKTPVVFKWDISTYICHHVPSTLEYLLETLMQPVLVG